MKKIVIFDMDGTLIDSKKDITISINHIRERHHNLSALSEEFVVEAINMQERNLPELFYGTQNYRDEDRVAFEKHYRVQCTKNPYLYDGIAPMLEYLKQADVKLSVATNAPTIFAKRMLTHLGVANMFDVIIGADRVSASKPSPEMLLYILEQYKYRHGSDSAWMIGDNSKDMMSAKNANIKALFALWGFSTYGEHKRVLKHPSEILREVL